MFSEDFVDETIRTLCLLFPSTDHTDNFIKRYHSLLLSEYPFLVENRHEIPATPLTDFVIWRDRLSVLYNEYSAPGSLWNDRRNTRDWLNFWLGIGTIIILTVVFGVISVVLAAIGLQYSHEQLLIAKAAAVGYSNSATFPSSCSVIATVTRNVVKF